jgi:hypothetical protein
MSEDTDDDPFERLGDVDRDGDPFERLNDAEGGDREDTGDPTASRDDDSARSGGDEWPDEGDEWQAPNGEGWEPAPTDRSMAGGSSTGDQGFPAGDPPADIEREPADDDTVGSVPSGAGTDTQSPADGPFADMNTPEEDPFGTGQGVFEQVDAGSVDADEVWDSITDDGDGGDGLVVPDGSRYAEVSKHAFCEQCEHFSEPPDVHCSREGTEIIEFLDMETVRLLDCPVVADREELE